MAALACKSRGTSKQGQQPLEIPRRRQYHCLMTFPGVWDQSGERSMPVSAVLDEDTEAGRRARRSVKYFLCRKFCERSDS